MVRDGKRVTIIGSGNWGSAIARVVGVNANECKLFDPTVLMYVYEEIIDGIKLSETINNIHENIKYLPGYKLPSNIIAVPDLKKSVADADILIFVIPHQFISKICQEIKFVLKPTAIAVSLIKGFEKTSTGVKLISQVIQNYLNIQVCVLMGANLANGVAKREFCETTIGCRDRKHFLTLKKLFETSYFKVTIVEDKETVEACGALKNIVACAAGFCDGLQLGDNTKAAVIRLGLMEMVSFVKTFNQYATLSTFFESCGIADLITTCYGGRNRKVAQAFVETKKPMEVLEKEMLNGQKLQGPITAEEVFHYIEINNKENEFPLFTAVHKICTKKVEPEKLIQFLVNHPEHRLKSNL